VLHEDVCTCHGGERRSVPGADHVDRGGPRHAYESVCGDACAALAAGGVGTARAGKADASRLTIFQKGEVYLMSYKWGGA